MTLGKLSLAILCAALAPTMARSQAGQRPLPPWRDLGVGPAGRVLLDTAHVVTDSVGMRIRVQFTEPEQVLLRDPQGTVHAGTPLTTEIDTYIDCASRRVWEKEVAVFDSAGVRQGGFTLPETTWSDVSRRQTAQLYFEPACAGLRAAGKL